REMVKQGSEIVGEGGDIDFAGVSHRRGFAMSPAIEGDHAKCQWWPKQAKGLAGIPTQTMLKNKRHAAAGFAVIEIQPIVMKFWHYCSIQSPLLTTAATSRVSFAFPGTTRPGRRTRAVRQLPARCPT